MRASAARPAHATAADVAAAAPPQLARSSPQESTTLSPQPSSKRSAAAASQAKTKRKRGRVLQGGKKARTETPLNAPKIVPGSTGSAREKDAADKAFEAARSLCKRDDEKAICSLASFLYNQTVDKVHDPSTYRAEDVSLRPRYTTPAMMKEYMRSKTKMNEIVGIHIAGDSMFAQIGSVGAHTACSTSAGRSGTVGTELAGTPGGTESNNQLPAIGGVRGEAETAAESSSALLSAASESHPHEGDKQSGCTRQKWDAAYRRNQKTQPFKASLSLLDSLNINSLQRVAQKLNETLPRNHYIPTKKVKGNGADVIRAEIRKKWTMAKVSKTDAENLTEATLLQL